MKRALKRAFAYRKSLIVLRWPCAADGKPQVLTERDTGIN